VIILCTISTNHATAEPTLQNQPCFHSELGHNDTNTATMGLEVTHPSGVYTVNHNATEAEQICVNGGWAMAIPVEQPLGFDSNFVGIAGNDTAFAPMAACCGQFGFPMQYAPPCMLWCGTGETTFAEIRQCWSKNGFVPEATLRLGPSGETAPVWLSRNQIVGISVGAALAVILALGSIIWCCVRRRRSQAREKTRRVAAVMEECRSKEKGPRVGFEPPQYGSGLGKMKPKDGYQPVNLGRHEAGV
ncbi:hypothetical protein Micbo1qcDRAFT_213273, partial [Microdochium bolleyi]